jgi:endonuclease III
MIESGLSLAGILDRLEAHYGNQEPCWPTDPYQFLVWWHCGYPASDTACAKGWESLRKEVGVGPSRLLEAGPAKLARALKPGGMVPELRAARLIEIAARIKDEYAGDLRNLAGPLTKVRQALKRFPNIADPGADRILLFGGIAPVPAVPSNCPHVLVRILQGLERENYGVTYGEAKTAIEAGIPATFDARTRAYLLLKRQGQELCKRNNPHCDRCPLASNCAFFAHKYRGRSAPTVRAAEKSAARPLKRSALPSRPSRRERTTKKPG